MPDQQPPQIVGTATLSTIGSAAEQDLLVLKNDQNLTIGSSYSFYHKITLGSNTEIDLRYYGSFIAQPGVNDWYQVPFKSIATGAAQISDSFSKVTGTPLKFIDIFSTGNSNFQFPACWSFKVTAKGNNAAADGVVTVTAFQLNH